MSIINNLFNRVVETKMPGPKVYFQSMTTEEVLRYASQYAETELEKVLAERLDEALDTVVSLAKDTMLSWELNDAGEDLVSEIEDIISEEDADVVDAVEKYKKRVNAAYIENQKG